jgi:hypothetical protein
MYASHPKKDGRRYFKLRGATQSDPKKRYIDLNNLYQLPQSNFTLNARFLENYQQLLPDVLKALKDYQDSKKGKLRI